MIFIFQASVLQFCETPKCEEIDWSIGSVKPLEMSPISPTTAPLDSLNSLSTSKKDSKWKVLASAISRKREVDANKSLIRFPSYQVIRAQAIEPPENESESLDWFSISLPGFSLVKLKVSCYHWCVLVENQGWGSREFSAFFLREGNIVWSL